MPQAHAKARVADTAASPARRATAAPVLPIVRRRRKEARPLELLSAALDVFVEKGFASARIEDVAARAGVSKGTLYLYYSSKEALLKAVIEHYFVTHIAQGAQRAAAHRGPVAPFLRNHLTQSWMELFSGPASAVIKLMFAEVRNFPDIAAFYASEVIEPADRVIGTLIERGIATGEFRSVDVNDAVHSLMGPLVLLCLHKHSFGACMLAISDADTQRFFGNHLDLIIGGLLHKDSHS